MSIAAYIPAFAIIAGLKLRLNDAVLLSIAITLVLACFYIWLLTCRLGGFREYGFRLCASRYLLLAVILAPVSGLPLNCWHRNFQLSIRSGCGFQTMDADPVFPHRRRHPGCY
ncbi:MAG TPA: hypothetical protein VFK12_06735 [Gammaproteobacteria bacterium]|nr:hypothetical protein [Gammaproteobacteria bacterium]